jgi:hypothetical protein
MRYLIELDAGRINVFPMGAQTTNVVSLPVHQIQDRTRSKGDIAG